MLIYFDKALEELMKKCSIDGKPVTVKPREAHIELREEQKYPSISYFRMDKEYDKSRFTSENETVKITEDGIEYVDTYVSPEPINLFWQVELLAKEMYHIDMLEMSFETHIRNRGGLPIQIYEEQSKSVKQVVFPLIVEQYRQMDEFENATKNSYYRRIYTLKAQILLDYNIIIATHQRVANEVIVYEE